LAGSATEASECKQLSALTTW